MPEEISDNEICPICMDQIIDKCSVPTCSHVFCKKCIILVVLSQSDVCPYCRTPFKYTELKLKETNTTLFEPFDLKILGSVYIQGNLIGLASYHFESETDCYISYASPECALWPPLDNGERPPEKKPFVNITIDESKRMFCGDIQWNPVSWQGDVLWKYEMHFSEDYSCIESGSVIGYDKDENITRNVVFGVGLNYKRSFMHDFKQLLLHSD